MARLEQLTSGTRGAIAVLRLTGPDAIEVGDRVFRQVSGDRLAASGVNRLRFGRIGSGLGDEVVAVITDRTPPSVEFQCHGGVMAVELVCHALLAAGASWGDEAGERLMVIEREAIADLSQARTVRTAEILLEQSQGALRAIVGEAIEDLRQGRRAEASARLDRSIDNARIGLRLLTGWRVALAGRPNVGKSRLLNALAGYERAIVDATPGTTRDPVAVQAAIGGWPIELIDTAGIRMSDDEIELMGVARSRDEHARADLVLLVLDRSVHLTDEDLGLIESNPDALLVASKSDLAAAWRGDQADLGGRSVVVVSAKMGQGLERLIEAMIGRLVGRSPVAGEGLPFRVEQYHAIGQARRFVAEGQLEAAFEMLGKMLE